MGRHILVVLGVLAVLLLGAVLVLGVHDMAGFGCGSDRPAQTRPVGERLARLAGCSTLRLQHQGRTSGKPYEVKIWFVVDGDTILLTTMNRGRQWVRNV